MCAGFTCFFIVPSFLSVIVLSDSLMYNKTDGDGWCFSAYCTEACKVEKHSKPCRQTTPPVPTTTQIQSTTPQPVKGCYYLKPPRKVFEYNFHTANQCICCYIPEMQMIDKWYRNAKIDGIILRCSKVLSIGWNAKVFLFVYLLIYVVGRS